MFIERIKVLVANDFSSKCYICESKYFQPTLQEVILVGAKGVDLSTDSNVDYFGLSWYIYLTLYMYVSSNKRKDKIAKADRIIMICCGTILYKLSMHGSNI